MPRHETIDVLEDDWTELSNADISSITLQNLTGYTLWLKGTTDATKPTDRDGAIELSDRSGYENQPLSGIWPGIAAVRVWAYSDTGGKVMVSHA